MKIKHLLLAGGLLCCMVWTALGLSAAVQAEKRPTTHPVTVQKNTPDSIRALISRMKAEVEKDDDTFPVLIGELELYTFRQQESPYKAVLHSMLAQLYNYYWDAHQWTIVNRTPLEGYVPEDMQVWTANIFADTILWHARQSLQPVAVLQQTPVATFNKILEPGPDSQTLRPTLFDFLSYRAISMLTSLLQGDLSSQKDRVNREIDTMYKQLIRFRKAEDNPKALLQAELGYQNYLYTRARMEDGGSAAYLHALDSLQQQYASSDLAAEVVVAKLQYYESYPEYGIMDAVRLDSLLALQYNLCKATIARYPDYDRIGILQNKMNHLTWPHLSVQSEQTVYPGNKLALRVSYKNVPRVTLSLYRSFLSPDNTPEKLQKKNAKGQRKLIQQKTFTLKEAAPYQMQDTTFYIPMDKLGLYEYALSGGGMVNEIREFFSVSKIASLSRTLDGATPELFVADMQSGKPLKDAQVLLYTSRKGGIPSYHSSTKTDKDGFVRLQLTQPIAYYRVVQEKDSAMMLTSVYWNRYKKASRPEISTIRVSLFGDRNMYRPGQTVFFAGIVYGKDKEEKMQLLTNTSCTVAMFDANNQLVAKKELRTDEFGSLSGSFVLPGQVRSGWFRIGIGEKISYDEGNFSFRVEEYKLPSFELQMKPVTQEVKFGDLLYLTGVARTFSGMNIRNAKVTYKIVRRPQWLRRNLVYSRPQQVANGSVVTAADGKFEIPFTPEKAPADVHLPEVRYTYEVTAFLTDANGETQSGQAYFQVGDRSLVLSTDLPDKVDKKAVRLTISAHNLNAQPVETDGAFSVVLLKEKAEESSALVSYGSVDGVDDYEAVRTVYQGRFVSGKPVDAADWATWPSGRYRLVMQAKDVFGRMAQDSTVFILYGLDDRKPPVQTAQWILPVQTTCEVGEVAKIIFGTSLKNAEILYELIQENNVLKREFVKMSDANKMFEIPYQKEYGGGILVSFTYIKDGVCYSEEQEIMHKEPDYNLTIRTETFRDLLYPGQSETWKFKVMDADSSAVIANLFATMYDKALDTFSPYNWNFHPRNGIFIPRFYWNMGSAFQMEQGSMNGKLNVQKVPFYQFDQLDWQGLLSYIPDQLHGVVYMSLAKTEGTAQQSRKMMASRSANEFVQVMQDEVLAESVVASVPISAGLGEKPAIQIRQNFNETAFFYPSLRTDENGMVSLAFEVPQSNTTWKFMSLAYTHDLKYGQLQREVVTQKKLMVQPYLPRFIRQGDTIRLTTQVLNMTSQHVSGQVRLDLFDPLTGQSIAGLSFSPLTFEIPAEGIDTAGWNVSIPQGIGLVGCRITAQSPEASDGEQHLIPVLPDEIQVTESTPFVLTGEGKKTIDTEWSPLSSTMRPLQMTLELSANPVWYAVQALPSLTTADKDNTVSWFASYYGNTLASYIGRTNPRIKDIVSQWEKNGETKESLCSSLEKNQELKNILLQETPWVLEAKNESEQMQRLGLLFNLNHASGLRREALDKLQTLQLSDGSWSWYKGMPANRAVTLYILRGMAQLTAIGAVEYSEQEKMMQINALRYLDKSVQQEYESFNKRNTQATAYPPLTTEIIEFLFVRSAYRDIPEYGNARNAIRYYTGQAEKEWSNQSLYGKALIAQLLYRNGHKNTAVAIVNNLKQLASQSPALGMYWANNKYSEGSFVSPVSIHCQLMDAIAEIEPGNKNIDLMKQWLLMQKQTQQWNSVPATVYAIYTLLHTGSDWLENQSVCTVKWGKQTYSTRQGTAGIGYIQTTVPGKDLTADMDILTIDKSGQAPAWGAVYRQYMEKPSQVKASGGALKIEKKLFVKQTVSQGEQLVPVEPGRLLKVGDRATVRMIVTSDRTMDFVQLKDMRAGCFEPVNQLSGTVFAGGGWCYRSPGDVAENFFLDRLKKGTYVLEYDVYVVRAGYYTGGICTIQCLYAPEFVAHTAGASLIVEE